MPWWAWIVLGTALLGAEVVLATDFYLVFFGLSALVLGLGLAFGVPAPAWAQWLVFAALSIAALVVYRRRLRDYLSKPEKELGDELVGKTALATAGFGQGTLGRVELRGTVWQARNEGTTPILSGHACEVLRVDGLTLCVRKATPATTSE